MRIAAITLALALAASPAAAKWHYCYDGDAPAGVNRYTDYPPRTFGFEIAVLPYNFKRLCGVDMPGLARRIHPAQPPEVIRQRRDFNPECARRSIGLAVQPGSGEMALLL